MKGTVAALLFASAVLTCSMQGASAQDEFCEASNLDSFGVGEQASLVKSTAAKGNAVQVMQDLRGGAQSNSMKAIIKSQQWQGSAGQSYATGLAVYAAPGIVLGVVMLFFWITLSACRMCRRCCKPTKAVSEYTKCEKCTPVIWYLISGLVCCVCSIIGLVYILQGANVITGSVCAVDVTRIDASNFFKDINAPISRIAGNISDVADSVSASMDNVDNLPELLEKIQSGLSNITSTLEDLPSKLPQGLSCPNSVCVDMAATTDDSEDEFTESAGPTVNSIGDLSKSITAKVINAKGNLVEISKIAEGINGQVQNFTGKEWDNLVKSAKAQMAPVKANFVNSSLIFFGFSFAAIIITLVGLFFLACGKYTNCTGTRLDKMDDCIGAYLVFFGWWTTSIVVVALFFIGGALLAVSVATSDVCVILEDFPNDMDSYIGKAFEPVARGGGGGDGDSGGNAPSPSSNSVSLPQAPGASLNPVAILQGCYNNESIFVSLNMSGSFNIEALLNFTAIDSYSTGSSALDVPDDLSQLQDDVDALTPATFGCGSGCPQNASDKVQEIIDDLGYQVSNVTTNIDGLKSAADASIAPLANVRTYLAPIFDDVDVLMENGKCDFVKSHYLRVTTLICDDGLNSLLYVALTMLLSGLFGIIMVVSGLRINQRYGGHGDTTDATVANAEGGFEMETEDFKRSDFDRAEDEEGDAELGNKKEEEDDDEKKKKEEEEEEAPVEEAAQPYVYNDEDDDFPYVDEYTHLDDEHYFAQEADHDAETGII